MRDVRAEEEVKDVTVAWDEAANFCLDDLRSERWEEGRTNGHNDHNNPRWHVLVAGWLSRLLCHAPQPAASTTPRRRVKRATYRRLEQHERDLQGQNHREDIVVSV